MLPIVSEELEQVNLCRSAKTQGKILIFADLRIFLLLEIRETQMLKSFLTDASQPDSPSVFVQSSTNPSSGREFVKVIVVGSPKGIVKIIHTLYRLGFAEVTE